MYLYYVGCIMIFRDYSNQELNLTYRSLSNLNTKVQNPSNGTSVLL